MKAKSKNTSFEDICIFLWLIVSVASFIFSIWNITEIARMREQMNKNTEISNDNLKIFTNNNRVLVNAVNDIVTNPSCGYYDWYIQLSKK